MPKGKRASPGVGHNSGLADHGDIRAALALDILFDEQKATLNERHKRARAAMEGKGVSLAELKFLKGLAGQAGSEVEALFRRQWHFIGAIFEKLTAQYDLFAPKPSAPERQAASFTLGLMAGLYGKELVIPPAIVGDDRDEMIRGHNEGADRRTAAKAEILTFALDPKNAGKTTDGTAAAVGAKAAADFAKDQGEDPLVVNGEKYPNMRQANAARSRLAQETAASSPTGTEVEHPPEAKPQLTDPLQPSWIGFSTDPTDWFAAQKRDFEDWFAKVPADVTPMIEHEGVRQAFETARVRQAEGFEATAEELAAQNGRPQTGDIPDEATVAAEAEKLTAAGFVAAKGRGRSTRASKG